MTSSSHYATLGVEQDASQDEIKTAFKRLSLANHPDKHRDNIEAATAKQTEINHAYEVLRTEKHRAQYDATLTKNNADEEGEDEEGYEDGGEEDYGDYDDDDEEEESDADDYPEDYSAAEAEYLESVRELRVAEERHHLAGKNDRDAHKDYDAAEKKFNAARAKFQAVREMFDQESRERYEAFMAAEKEKNDA
ncbi:DnaJ domain-containing protein [Xylariaceae sp. FL1019]|nr:DnaJ domain-containing protein [Xylariaceae sp. FL1019]